MYVRRCSVCDTYTVGLRRTMCRTDTLSIKRKHIVLIPGKEKILLKG